MEQCKQVAREIHKSLPDSTHELLSHPFKGKIVTLSSGTDLASGRKEDVHNNAVFLKPCVRQWPQRVLSAYLYADIVLELDQLVAGNLLTPSKAWPKKKDLALQVGSKLKKLTSTLRQLGRRTKNSWSEEIRELKCLLETKKGGEAATLLLPGRDTEDTEGEGERDGEGEAPASEEGDRESPAEHKEPQQQVQQPQQQPLAAQRTTGQDMPESKLSESGQNMQRLNAKASAASRRLRPLSRVPKKWSSKGGRCLMWRPMNMRLACL